MTIHRTSHWARLWNVHGRRPGYRAGHYCSRVIVLLIVGSMALWFAGRAYAAQTEPPTPWYQPKFGDLVALIGIAAAVVTLGNGLWQANEARTWKRKEFMAAQMAAFLDDASVQRAMKILDYTARRIDLSDNKEEKALRNVRVDHRVAAGALIPHTFGREKFGRVEVAIRDIFDVFLERLDKFDVMLEAKLLRLEDVTPYLKYWLESIADTERFLDPALRRSLWLYIHEYEFHGVQALCEKIGHPIAPRAGDESGLREEITRGEWGPKVRPAGPQNQPVETDSE